MPEEPPPRNFIYVSAFFCERVLREYDYVLSAIRIVDFYSVYVPDANAAPFTPRLETNLIVMFRSEAACQFNWAIRVTDPSGLTTEERFGVQKVSGGGAAATVVVTIMINGVLEGTNWYEILLDGALASRVPLTVKHEQVPTSQAPQPTWNTPDADPSA